MGDDIPRVFVFTEPNSPTFEIIYDSRKGNARSLALQHRIKLSSCIICESIYGSSRFTSQPSYPYVVVVGSLEHAKIGACPR